MSKTTQCVRCVVLGKVQGVWFRANTQKKAQQLGVKGWVKNLPDGSVEVKATADTELLDEFIAWLHQGPDLAKVETVNIEFITYEEFETFEIK